jgi:hypothetical protein
MSSQVPVDVVKVEQLETREECKQALRRFKNRDGAE